MASLAPVVQLINIAEMGSWIVIKIIAQLLHPLFGQEEEEKKLGGSRLARDYKTVSFYTFWFLFCIKNNKNIVCAQAQSLRLDIFCDKHN